MGIKEWLQTKRTQKSSMQQTCANINDDVCKLWTKCFNCNTSIPTKDIEENLMVCTRCGYHFRINAKQRLCQIADPETFEEINLNMFPADPLNFVDTLPYPQRQEDAQKKTCLNEAVITGFCSINGAKTGLGIMDFEYMGGSMGSVVGEKITRLIEACIDKKLPVIIFTSSGGARMQESILSLMQMAKTSCAIARMNDEKLLYMTVLTEPTFGGVTASFGTLGDIIIAEQGARIGFAGRRVIEQTIRQKLPSDFQTAEYLLKFGQVDMICSREELKDRISNLIAIHTHK
ncbi:MAG: acetyl-CoA carboxylase, carboxyltransferase subunit beta [Candidatus Gastranaerophilales bacterium]|nr:acetyl-CoA carboxylase, carboxyltransferase subunit beta [Candidatus Gastranaerophilales bacterium]